MFHHVSRVQSVALWLYWNRFSSDLGEFIEVRVCVAWYVNLSSKLDQHILMVPKTRMLHDASYFILLNDASCKTLKLSADSPPFKVNEGS